MEQYKEREQLLEGLDFLLKSFLVAGREEGALIRGQWEDVLIKVDIKKIHEGFLLESAYSTHREKFKTVGAAIITTEEEIRPSALDLANNLAIHVKSYFDSKISELSIYREEALEALKK